MEKHPNCKYCIFASKVSFDNRVLYYYCTQLGYKINNLILEARHCMWFKKRGG